jgi:F-type H+-transporting ATPase subunit b
MMHILVSPQFDLAKDFGLNVNLYETNIINLLIVVGIFVAFGKGVFIDPLSKRKTDIANQVENALKTLEDTKAQLIQAKRDFELAKEKEIQIFADGESNTAIREIEITKAMDEKKKRLANANVSNIYFARKKEIEVFKQQTVKKALVLVKAYLKKNITPELHLKINDYQLNLFKSMPK